MGLALLATKGVLPNLFNYPHHNVAHDLETLWANLIQSIVWRMPEAVVEAILIIDQIDRSNATADERNVIVDHGFGNLRQILAITQLAS